MRSASEIQKLIIDFAKSDDRVRTVLLNGSRANPNIRPDKFQDFDIVFFVDNMESFICDHSWTNVFGEKLICQLPDEMNFGNNKALNATNGFHYLMLFTDENRIDLTLYPIGKLKTDFQLDSLTIVWLDKDKALTNVPNPTDTDYLIRRPTEEVFLATCNEFWWVSTYVAKGLLRNEITYAKEMLETIVRPMFMRVIEWQIGTETDFSKSPGKGGRVMKHYLPGSLYDRILETYADQTIENNWKSFFIMTKLFSEFATKVANKLNFQYNLKEEQNTLGYLKASYHGQR
jgi:aminoglycoside 6-adenylyltransferase